MVFLFIIPAVPAIMGNFILPMMLGAKDVAFPRLNLLSLWIYWIGGDRSSSIFSSAASFTPAFGMRHARRLGLDTGWTFYTPYSTDKAMGSVTIAVMGVVHARDSVRSSPASISSPPCTPCAPRE